MIGKTNESKLPIYEYYYVYFKPRVGMRECKISLEKAERLLGNVYVDVGWVLTDAQVIAEHSGVGSIAVRGGGIEVRIKK